MIIAFYLWITLGFLSYVWGLHYIYYRDRLPIRVKQLVMFIPITLLGPLATIIMLIEIGAFSSAINKISNKMSVWLYKEVIRRKE